MVEHQEEGKEVCVCVCVCVCVRHLCSIATQGVTFLCFDYHEVAQLHMININSYIPWWWSQNTIQFSLGCNVERGVLYSKHWNVLQLETTTTMEECYPTLPNSSHYR